MSQNTPFPEEISQVERGGFSESTPSQAPGSSLAGGAPSFEEVMQQTANPSTPSSTPSLSPLELSASSMPNAASPPTLNTLLSQVNAAHATMGDLSTQLSHTKTKLRPSQRYILKNKLSEASSHIYSVAAKLLPEGATLESALSPGSPPLPVPISTHGPLERFLDYLTEGQHQLEGAKHHLEEMKNKGEALNPADFLLLQIKLNKAQQLLEYSSILLSKAVDDMKMLFNVQI